MRFGLGLSVQHLPEEPQAVRFREHVEQVRLARAVGFSSVWASQHYLSDPFTYFQPIPTLARLAADARGMILGTGVLLLPLHHPVDVAEQLATLDVITDGRLVFGVGLGYRDVENRAFGHDPKDRVGRFVEGLEVVERLWSGEPISHEGRYFSLRSTRISMRPMQSPRPPVWLAADGDAGVRRAARLGDAWLMNPHAKSSASWRLHGDELRILLPPRLNPMLPAQGPSQQLAWSRWRAASPASSGPDSPRNTA